ncbi:alpha/beta hydrolase [Nostocoides sp. F2B08]|uniref:alpha/beta hydrolase n=1 Tax=Nostocoides sp. F2B08 TaxID=2653936 RepID=UPI0012635A1E|nr:alpha/beta hydrolase [Tetrasphaera sp. F2B08]KAB7745298.1 alpha/beta hydrolase [Tetrasphaera sp. F2B08]
MSTPSEQTAAVRPAMTGLVLATVWIFVPLWVLVSRWDVLLAGHPAYLVLVLAVLAVGIMLAVRARKPRAPRSGARRILLGLGAVLATVTVVGAVAWLRPFGADQVALDLMTGTEDVEVTDARTSITLSPRAGEPTVGVVVQPGARVDPRAYVPLWEQVSAQGYLVVIVKQPLNIGFLALGAPSGVIDDHPEIGAWALSGHSLGGVAASEYIADDPQRTDALVLHASYPLGSLAGRDDLVAASISGSADGLSTPEDIEASRADLPADTVFTQVEGAVHAFFGDYGEQPGDGVPTIGREEAQEQIVAATVEALERIS